MPNIPLKVYKFKSIKEIIDGDFCPSILIGMYILHFWLFVIYIVYVPIDLFSNRLGCKWKSEN